MHCLSYARLLSSVGLSREAAFIMFLEAQKIRYDSDLDEDVVHTANGSLPPICLCITLLAVRSLRTSLLMVLMQTGVLK